MYTIEPAAVRRTTKPVNEMIGYADQRISSVRNGIEPVARKCLKLGLPEVWPQINRAWSREPAATREGSQIRNWKVRTIEGAHGAYCGWAPGGGSRNRMEKPRGSGALLRSRTADPVNLSVAQKPTSFDVLIRNPIFFPNRIMAVSKEQLLFQKRIVVKPSECRALACSGHEARSMESGNFSLQAGTLAPRQQPDDILQPIHGFAGFVDDIVGACRARFLGGNRVPGMDKNGGMAVNSAEPAA